MNVFLWHLHGSWTTAFVQGRHDYWVPVLPDRGRDGLGRALTWDWPASVHEVTPQQARQLDVDAVVVQRPSELFSLAEQWLGRRPGVDVGVVYLEHDAPQGRVNAMRHPAADRSDLRLVHVTNFNSLMWDAGSTATTVVEHGIVDPGYRYRGDRESAAVVVNEPVRRGRVSGTDLLEGFGRVAHLELYGMGTEELGGHGNLVQEPLHEALAGCRAYLHPYRWTSLGLSLIEAMHLGLPVVALGTTEAAEAVPADAGCVSTRLASLEEALGRFIAEPEEARMAGKSGREAALARFGLGRFLADWDGVLEEVAR